MARHVCTAGILSATTFGEEVNGTSDAELKILRQVFGAATAPATSGRSLKASLLSTGDPTWRPATAPIRRWHKELWRIANSDERAKFSADQMQVAWDTAVASKHEMYSDEGFPKWSATRGPVSSMFLSLERIGWTFENPTMWVDDLGVGRDIVEFGPKLFDQFLKASFRRRDERDVAKAMGFATLEGKRACFDVVREYLTAPNRNCKRSKDAVLAVACNAVWTRKRLADAGYDVGDTTCELCNDGNDTLYHRLWCCTAPAVVAVRKRTASKKLIWAALRAGEDDPMFTHGVLPHPAEPGPGPQAQMKMEAWHIDGDEALVEGRPRMSGTMYADGHATRTGVDELNRASWAIIELSDDGELRSYLRGCVPATYPQTAQAAEYMAAAVSTLVAEPEATLYDDCANVVRDFYLHRDDWVDEKKSYAGLMKQAREWDGDSNLRHVLKVKGHLDFKDASMSHDERRNAYGNHLADKHADDAEALHPPILDLLARKALIKQAKGVLDVIAAVLPEWPRSEHQYDRTPTAQAAARSKARVPNGMLHQWSYNGKLWRCATCRTKHKAKKLAPYRKRQRCKGLKDALAANAAIDNGHVLTEFSTTEGDFTICYTCGRYGGTQAKKLKLRCEGKLMTTGAAKAWTRVFERTKHPYTNVSFSNHDALRAKMITSVGVVTDYVLPKPKEWVSLLRSRRKKWMKRKTIRDLPGLGPVLNDNLQSNKLRESRKRKCDVKASGWLVRNTRATIDDGIPDPQDIEEMQQELGDPLEDVRDYFGHEPAQGLTGPSAISDVTRNEIAMRRQNAVEAKTRKRNAAVTDNVRDAIAIRKKAAIDAKARRVATVELRGAIAIRRKAALEKRASKVRKTIATIVKEPKVQVPAEEWEFDGDKVAYNVYRDAMKRAESATSSSSTARPTVIVGELLPNGPRVGTVEGTGTAPKPEAMDVSVSMPGTPTRSLPDEPRVGAVLGEGTVPNSDSTAVSVLDGSSDVEMVAPVPCCFSCGHLPDSELCCSYDDKKQRACKPGVPKMRFGSKAKGCYQCQGPCVRPQTAASSQDQDLQAEVDELNAPVGNWRHRKAHNAAIREAVLRPRLIPTIEEAQTEAQRKMAALAARFRK